ncbi:MAG: 16S rRNA (cytidine(1402)-2'-O)-methyltransferase [Nitriliruptoraceae bacterium]
MSGTLAVVATPIGNLDDLSPRAAATLREADLVLAEDTRRTGRLLAHIGSEVPQRSLHGHNERASIDEVITRLRAGARIALVSDAGTPAVSDPGARLLAACVEAGIRIEPVPGPSAALAALVASGLPTERVAFEGFLPRKGRDRRERLAEIAGEARTVVLFITPHRAAADLDDLASTCGPDRPAVLCRELTKLHEEVVHGDLEQLAERARTGLRGEITLVVAGAQRSEPAALSDAELAAQVAARVASGATHRDAIRAVAEVTGTPKRRVYQSVVDAER